MQNKIKSCTNFTEKVDGDPILLLKAIKQHTLNYQEHCYEISIMVNMMDAGQSRAERE
jgi:hypothetical protein